ncbi:MAG: hypothetical protein AAGD25_23675 [Cyanobacteria bacterium P01_F01_bin.150]
MPCQLILYACPTGPLADQIEDYLAESRRIWGENKAHQYMPHCTLTGFFHDRQEAIALYRQTLTSIIPDALKTPATIQIMDLLFKDAWHGLTIESPWLLSLAQSLAANANSPTRTEDLRLKTWLHVSLAYGFDAAHGEGLKQLALERVDPNTAVEWEIRFYERSPANKWQCHGSWRV